MREKGREVGAVDWNRREKRQFLPADPVRGYFHVVIQELAAPDTIHNGMDFPFQ